MKFKNQWIKIVLATLFVLLAAGSLLWLRVSKRQRAEIFTVRNASAAPAASAGQRATNILLAAQASSPGSPNAVTATPSSSGSAASGRSPGDDGQISTSAMKQIAALEAAKQLRTPVQDKIDSQLIYADKMRRGDLIATGVPTQRVDLDRDPKGRVLVDITATVTTELLAYIETKGGDIINNFPQYQAIRASLPLAVIETIAARTEVKFIKPAARAVSNNIDSEGDVTHQANIARATFEVAGTGVKVGVLSDSVDSLTNSQVGGLVTVLAGQSGSTATGEGTAMLELVNDLAPGAQLFFATARLSEASFANNIQQLRNAGCDIIVDDEYYNDEPPFQDGIIAQAVNAVTASGALYFSSSGNSGNLDSGTSGTWEGDFADGGPAVLEAGRIHAFAVGTNYDTVLPGGSLHRLDLFWADPQGASTNDYDVAVLDSTGTSVVASSTTRQNGGQNPYESIGTLLSGERIVIIQYSGTGRFLHLETGRGFLSLGTSGNTKGHGCATNAFCVAAVSATNTYPGPFTSGPGDPVETFSSDGPRRVFFQADGTPITPGNFSASGGAVRQKPEIAAADGVSTDLAAFTPFFGTSAAAPHAAAMAALLKSYNPALTPSQIRTFFTNANLDIMSPGVDRDSGYGIVMAPALLQAAPPEPLRVTPQTGFNTAGYAGGPFSVTSQTFTLTNVGAAPFSWALVNTSAWLSASSSVGSLTPGGLATVVKVSLNTTASNLPPGIYNSTLNFTNQTTGIVRSRSFSLTINEPLQIGPATGFVAAGNVNGPFDVTAQTYSLTNVGAQVLTWSVINTSSWLKVSSPGGTLPAGGSAQISVSLNNTASNLPPSLYGSTLVFTNQTSGTGQSRAFALTIYQWTPISAPASQWQSVASSADGTRWVAAALNGGIYVFTNSGAGWFQTPAPTAFWIAVAASSDAGKMIAAAQGGALYTSTDGGGTWTSNSTPLETWEGVAASADGSRFVASANFDVASHPGVIYGTTNSGGLWNKISPANNYWAPIASSADGFKLAAALIGGSIWASTNAGTTWTISDAPGRSWQSIASSADGTRMVAAAFSTLIYTSTNSGLHWMTNTLHAANWQGIASSANGLKLVAVANGLICTSTDAGITWSTNTAPNEPWVSVASSADGSLLVAVASNGAIYVSKTQVSSLPLLSISPVSNQFVIAWPTNATSFVLQQNVNLATTNWTTVTNAVNPTGNQNQVFISPLTTNRYYRLFQQ
jgi:hypothetical protein